MTPEEQDSEIITCGECEGTGEIEGDFDLQWQAECPECDGTGIQPEDES